MPRVRIYRGEKDDFLVVMEGYAKGKRSLKSARAKGKEAAKQACADVIAEWTKDKEEGETPL